LRNLYILTSILAVGKRFFFPTSSPAFVVICFLNDLHSDWHVMESHSSFDLQFPDD
jgi:hypothetical protein